MRAIRGFLIWMFALWGLVCLLITAAGLRAAFVHPAPAQNLPHPLQRFVLTAAFGLTALIFCTAGWTGIRKKPSTRAWGITACLTLVILSFFPVLAPRIFHWHLSHIPPKPLYTTLCTGIVGALAFSRRVTPAEAAAAAAKPVPIPGDGTSKLVNVAAGVAAFAASYGVFIWWGYWRRAKGISRPLASGALSELLWLMLLGLVIALVHELGHTLAGKAAGMRLRSFVVGPFRVVLHEGVWRVSFDLKKIFSAGGATGMVPATADFPTSSLVRMVAAGPLVNLGTGLAALWIAYAKPGSAPIQAAGLLALFGAFSLVACVYNLIPLGSKSGYSDGAKIYQLLSGGPWGDFHRAVAMAGAGLVTELRPRDYDIGVIEKAATGIRKGREGLLLRLFAYNYQLDRSDIDAAGHELREAARIYEESASSVPAEFLTLFVFGYACILRDAASARTWWDRMEARKPTRLNVDYWRAKSALGWIEGNLEEANEAWDKAADAALKLPRAGAYEFDRDLCGFLLAEMEESARQQAAPVAVAAMG